MIKTRAVLSTASVLALLWLGLSMSLEPEEIVLGLAAGLVISAATGGALTGDLTRLLKPARLFAAIEYVFFFMGQMIRANVDIFLRVFRPVIPVKPGIVRARLKLRSPRAKAILANSITLTPGTLTIDLRDESIFVLWVFLPPGDVHARTQRMVDSFAVRLEKIFE